MKLSHDDPRITAYALGEIEDAVERKEIKAALAESPELQETVRQIREFGGRLSAGLQTEPVPELSDFDKARMGQPSAKRGAPDRLRNRRILSWPGMTALTGAAAVALLVFVLVPSFDNPQVSSNREIFLDTLEVATPDPLPPEEPQQEVVIQNEADMEREMQAAPLDQLELSLPAPDGVLELPRIEIANSNSVGYVSTNTTAGTRLNTTLSYSAGVVKEQSPAWNTESYDVIEESGFRSPIVAPLSTFAIDVDTASYANVRRFLKQGALPPKDAVRIEELINYFPYSDAPPRLSLEEGGDPFAVHIEQTNAPWNTDNRILRIGIKGYEMPWEERPASNLVFLLDVSGSMDQHNKLPLVKQSMNMLVRRLGERDRVAIVVYAGASGLALPSTTANNHETISHALNSLSAGGSTNGGAGIQLAYKVAMENFIADGNNRVILCTDGDFNVGQTQRGSLSEFVEEQAEKGVSLTILGFGMGNYKDGMLEALSNKGKGSYAYIDTREEARKVFREDLASNLFKIAKDVKIQVEFNPEHVSAYRLIGYENRRLKAEDFNDDKKKAGDIGPGHSIVALYEIVPAGREIDLPAVDDLRYQRRSSPGSGSGELATVKLRYKRPEGEVSKLILRTVRADGLESLEYTSDDFRFSVAVAAFGMLLSDSEHINSFSFREVEKIASGALGTDPGGHRSEFVDLVRQADLLRARK